ncbi:MAG: hypothetical protein DBX55_05920 [Verrucomicrobia bacterium]|nr:MAG: hypothetical protein DBX55_05920 [Verrucomicrobiota bacterium]
MKNNGWKLCKIRKIPHCEHPVRPRQPSDNFKIKSKRLLLRKFRNGANKNLLPSNSVLEFPQSRRRIFAAQSAKTKETAPLSKKYHIPATCDKIARQFQNDAKASNFIFGRHGNPFPHFCRPPSREKIFCNAVIRRN